MIWTAVFTDKSHLVFSTASNNLHEAMSYLRHTTTQKLFVLMKGNHSNKFYF